MSRLVLTLFVVALVVSGCSKQETFTKAAWQKHPTVDCSLKDYRQPMIDDLLKNHLGQGMTRTEVRRIMGPPDFADSTQLSKGWDYEIGLDVSDCSFVYVGFNSHDKLVQWFDSRDPLDER